MSEWLGEAEEAARVLMDDAEGQAAIDAWEGFHDRAVGLLLKAAAPEVVAMAEQLTAVETDRDEDENGAVLVTFRVSRGGDTVELSEWLRADGTVERTDSNVRAWLSEAAAVVAPPHASFAGPDYDAIHDAMDRALRGAENTTPVRCVSDDYDQDGGTYDSVEDFLSMCATCFGERPELREVDGSWYEVQDDNALGQLVLRDAGL